jgi:four helix bundle protein
MDFGLRDQIHRAIVSVMSDITEGYEHGAEPSFINFWSLPKAHVVKFNRNFI